LDRGHTDYLFLFLIYQNTHKLSSWSMNLLALVCCLCATLGYCGSDPTCTGVACPDQDAKCPASTASSSFGSGCCGITIPPTACETTGGCTTVGCNKCRGDDGSFKKCAAQGCFKDPTYNWYVCAFESLKAY
jgi:hypothetical protein